MDYKGYIAKKILCWSERMGEAQKGQIPDCLSQFESC